MKAFLLAAGVGSRLRPITDTIPKCMVPVGGQLSRLLDLVGYPVAYRWLATAAPFDAVEAERHGFVTEIHRGATALDRALTIAQGIAAVSPSVVAASWAEPVRASPAIRTSACCQVRSG